ncbi:sugar ABC transporter ATP-binding protein, partial [Mesorhizobium sp. M7A.F.Ca.US.006.01.1.1]
MHNVSREDFVEGIVAEGICKHFGHVEALRGVNLTVRPGEIVALLGDNGAGKSTFSKVISGHYTPSEGRVLIDGQPVSFASVREAQAAGVEMVYQDLALAPDLTVAENVFLGREIPAAAPYSWFGMLDRPKMAAESAEVLKMLAIQG